MGQQQGLQGNFPPSSGLGRAGPPGFGGRAASRCRIGGGDTLECWEMLCLHKGRRMERGVHNVDTPDLCSAVLPARSDLRVC